MKALLTVILCLSFSIPFAAQASDPVIVARITVKSEAETLRVAQLGLDLMEYRDGDDLIFWTTRSQLSELKNAGWEVRIDKQLTAELPGPDQNDTFLGGYRTVEETRAFLDQMQTQYPNLASVFTYGQSWEKTRNPANGHDLFAIRLTSARTGGVKPKFFLEAGIHARELVPPEIATRFVEYLLTNYNRDADVTWLLNEHEIIVIPIVNPDGRKIAETGLSKRKNTNNLTGNCSAIDYGIDLNRNFSYLWGTINMPSEPPCGQTFPGLSAASEPEADAIEVLLDSLYPDQRGPGQTAPAPLNATGIFLDMHSTGNLILYPWGENSTPPPNLQLRTIARKMASYNGYNPIQSIDLYPTSGTAREYAYGELGVAGLAMEIGNGSGSCGGFMPAFSCVAGGTNGNFWNLNRPALLYMAKIARTPYMTSEGPTTDTLTFTYTGSTYTFRARVSDQNNGGENISAVEIYVNRSPTQGGTPITMTPEDGAFNSPSEFAGATMTLSLRVRNTVFVRGRDSAGNWGPVTAVYAETGNRPGGSNLKF